MMTALLLLPGCRRRSNCYIRRHDGPAVLVLLRQLRLIGRRKGFVAVALRPTLHSAVSTLNETTWLLRHQLTTWVTRCVIKETTWISLTTWLSRHH